jgi:ATP-dependent HslUV protease subunit HslV
MQNLSSAADPIGWHGTTILCVRRDGHVTMAGDGQVSMGQTIVKGNARKVRRIGAGGTVIAGFAGATAVADKDRSFTLTGNGDVLEPDDGVIGIGSGGNYALSAARALMAVADLTAEEIARRSMKIAADICVYTNGNIIIESI